MPTKKSNRLYAWQQSYVLLDACTFMSLTSWQQQTSTMYIKNSSRRPCQSNHMMKLISITLLFQCISKSDYILKIGLFISRKRYVGLWDYVLFFINLLRNAPPPSIYEKQSWLPCPAFLHATSQGYCLTSRLAFSNTAMQNHISRNKWVTLVLGKASPLTHIPLLSLLWLMCSLLYSLQHRTALHTGPHLCFNLEL